MLWGRRYLCWFAAIDDLIDGDFETGGRGMLLLSCWRPRSCWFALFVSTWAVLFAPLSALADMLVRPPYLQSGTPTSMIVRWRTDVPSDSVVHYGVSDGALGVTASNSTVTTDHEVVITGLSPYTKYYYDVGKTGQVLAATADQSFVTSPVVGTCQPIRIWAVGDSGAN